MLALAPDQELLKAVGEFVAASERAGGKAIYAGKIAVNALQPRQLPASDWDAFVLVQSPSRGAYTAAAAASSELQQARARLANSYALGMRRPRLPNLLLPLFLLAKRCQRPDKARPWVPKPGGRRRAPSRRPRPRPPGFQGQIPGGSNLRPPVRARVPPRSTR